jgi:hypothetical protein
MGQKLLLDYSPTGVQHSIETDENGFYAVEHTPTVVEDEILDECSKLRSLHQRKSGGFQLAAKVPILTHTMWKQEWRTKYRDTWTWPTFLSMKLNNRDNQNLRVGFKRSGAMKL